MEFREFFGLYKMLIGNWTTKTTHSTVSDPDPEIREGEPGHRGGGRGPGPLSWIGHCSISFSYIVPSKTHICSFWTSCFFTFTLPHLTQRRNAYIKPRGQTRILQGSYKTWRWQLKFPIPLAKVMVKYLEFARAVLVWDRIQIVETTRLWFWSGIGYGF